MASPYVGEIRIFAGNFAPVGWEFCEGQLLPITEYETLFQLIGTTYGGDGESTFALPDLRGRFPVHVGAGFVVGQSAGAETVTLTDEDLPSHTHTAVASGGGNVVSPQNAFWSTDPFGNTAAYTTPPATPANMNANAIGNTGGGQPHENRQPYLAVSFIISMFGVFPTQD
ncbi:MAG TPA: tail fiber protein [Bryobacteraceae bacterium]|nr:tail fiber protein [Bryobacteraceae bacterium]